MYALILSIDHRYFRPVSALLAPDSAVIHVLCRILVLENGSVTERGNHAELLALNGTYAKMWNDQVSDAPSSIFGRQSVVSSISDAASAVLEKQFTVAGPEVEPSENMGRLHSPVNGGFRQSDASLDQPVSLCYRNQPP